MDKLRIAFLIVFLGVSSFGFGQQIQKQGTKRVGLRKLKSDGLRKLKSDGMNKVESQEQPKKVASRNMQQDPNRLEGMSLIIDRTLSKDGREFYRLFYNEITFSGFVSDFNIEIMEKPLPGIGTQISILVDNTLIYRQRVQPKHDLVKGFALQGAKAVQQYALRKKRMQRQLGEEIYGTGI